jgi:DNA-directed RNA polymerase sigma subunit (sigma70/sigma32)
MDPDICLIERIKNEHDSDSLQMLIDRHSGIYLDTVNKIISNTCGFVDKGEIINDKDYSIYSAALKYEPSRNTKFSTYLANETRWRCLNIYNKNKKFQKEPLEDQLKEVADSHVFLEDIEHKEAIKKVFNITNKQKDKRIKKIIDMRYGLSYNKPHSWKEIAESLSMSIQGCIDIHDKFLTKIRKEIQNA